MQNQTTFLSNVVFSFTMVQIHYPWKWVSVLQMHLWRSGDGETEVNRVGNERFHNLVGRVSSLVRPYYKSKTRHKSVLYYVSHSRHLQILEKILKFMLCLKFNFLKKEKGRGRHPHLYIQNWNRERKKELQIATASTPHTKFGNCQIQKIEMQSTKININTRLGKIKKNKWVSFFYALAREATVS